MLDQCLIFNLWHNEISNWYGNNKSSTSRITWFKSPLDNSSPTNVISTSEKGLKFPFAREPYRMTFSIRLLLANIPVSFRTSISVNPYSIFKTMKVQDRKAATSFFQNPGKEDNKPPRQPHKSLLPFHHHNYARSGYDLQ